MEPKYLYNPLGDEVVKEAYLQKPFSDDAGMNLLHGASLLLKKMLPQPPQEGE